MKKRIITVKIGPRERRDPVAMLAAIRAALRTRQIELRTKSDASDPAVAAREVALEQLETAALTAGTKVLEERAAQAVKTPANPEAIVKARRSLRQWITALGAAGWAIAVRGLYKWVTNA